MSPIYYFHSVVLMFTEERSHFIEITFTVDNHDQPLCTDVFAVGNDVLEDERQYTVTLTSTDRAVSMTATSSLVVMDNDCK